MYIVSPCILVYIVSPCILCVYSVLWTPTVNKNNFYPYLNLDSPYVTIIPPTLLYSSSLYPYSPLYTPQLIFFIPPYASSLYPSSPLLYTLLLILFKPFYSFSFYPSTPLIPLYSFYIFLLLLYLSTPLIPLYSYYASLLLLYLSTHLLNTLLVILFKPL